MFSLSIGWPCSFSFHHIVIRASSLGVPSASYSSAPRFLSVVTVLPVWNRARQVDIEVFTRALFPSRPSLPHIVAAGRPRPPLGPLKTVRAVGKKNTKLPINTPRPSPRLENLSRPFPHRHPHPPATAAAPATAPTPAPAETTTAAAAATSTTPAATNTITSRTSISTTPTITNSALMEDPGYLPATASGPGPAPSAALSPTSCPAASAPPPAFPQAPPPATPPSPQWTTFVVPVGSPGPGSPTSSAPTS